MRATDIVLQGPLFPGYCRVDHNSSRGTSVPGSTGGTSVLLRQAVGSGACVHPKESERLKRRTDMNLKGQEQRRHFTTFSKNSCFTYRHDFCSVLLSGTGGRRDLGNRIRKTGFFGATASSRRIFFEARCGDPTSSSENRFLCDAAELLATPVGALPSQAASVALPSSSYKSSTGALPSTCKRPSAVALTSTLEDQR